MMGGFEMRCTRIMGILVNSRVEEVPAVQHVLTKHGDIIRARVGLHETNEVDNSDEGLIILRLCGSKDRVDSLYSDLSAIDGVKVNQMEI
jgi:hypothetical protein